MVSIAKTTARQNNKEISFSLMAIGASHKKIDDLSRKIIDIKSSVAIMPAKLIMVAGGRLYIISIFDAQE